MRVCPHLAGTIPSYIGGWYNISAIRFWNTSYTGQLPDAISNLTTLTVLSLDHNLFTGTIPSGIGNLTNLEQLYLDDNLLTGTIPAGMSKLTLLTKLQLQDNFLTGTIPFNQEEWPYGGLNFSCNCYDLFPLWCADTVCAPCTYGICNYTNANFETIVTEEHPLAVIVVLGIFLGVCILATIASSVLLFIKRESFRRQGPFYSGLVHFGVVVGLVSGIIALLDPSDLLCLAFPWLFGVGFALIYGCLFIKTWTLYLIWRAAKEFRRPDLTPKFIILRVALYLAVEIAFLIVWTVVDPPKTNTFSSSADILQVQCSSQKYGYAFWIASIASKEAWMIFGLVLTILTKPLHKDRDDGKEIALAIYNVFAVSVIAIPLAFILQSIPEGQVVVQVGAVLLAFGFTLLSIFFSTWYHFFAGKTEVVHKFTSTTSSKSLTVSAGSDY